MRQTARCQPCLTGNGLLFLLGGTVAPLVTSLFAPCAPLFASLCAAPCVVPGVVLRAPCVVPDAVLRGPRVFPDAVPYQTSASQWKAWRAWWVSGRQRLTPSESEARLRVQTQLRIQEEQERFDDRPASIPNVHPYQAPGLLPPCTSPNSRERVLI